MELETPSEEISRETVCAKPPSGTISWRYDIPLLTNRLLVWDIVRVLVLAVVAMYVLVAMGGLIIERELIILPPVVFVVTLGIVLVLFAITGLVLGNRISAQFTVDPQGVTYEAHKRERVINRLAVALGLLSGNPSVAGAGMLAAGRERERILWSRVERVVVHRRERVVELRGGSRALQRLHCPPELFDAVVAAVEAYTDGRGDGGR